MLKSNYVHILNANHLQQAEENMLDKVQSETSTAKIYFEI